MPFFKTTQNIFLDNSEYFDPNWMDSDTLVLPPKVDWDYKTELKIENVDLWEVLWMSGGGNGVYAAWNPYAELYMITISNSIDSIFYGKNASKMTKKRALELGIILPTNKIWVDNDKMWIYE